MQKKIHIVSFDVPIDPNYGGILDVYLRARALKQAGFYIVIHAFEYGRGKKLVDKTICDEIYYYSRRGTISSLSAKPYIVNSRKNKLLLANLLKVDDPIILEGEHCTSFIHQLQKAGKRLLVRTHNVEWQYYRELANYADTVLKKTYYRTESRRLKHHEHHLFKAHLLCISKEDQAYYANKGAKTSLVYPPLFFENKSSEIKDYVLFHGNLSVSENIEAVNRILDEFENKSSNPKIIFSGKNPSDELISDIEETGFICIPNPDNSEMDKLISEAKAHLCIGFQRSGLKLKLLKALESGRPVIVTEEMIYGTDLYEFCSVWNGEESLLNAIENLEGIDESISEARIEKLKGIFSPEGYARLVEELLYSE